MRIKINAVVLSINERAAAGTATDKSGPALIDYLKLGVEEWRKSYAAGTSLR